MVEPPPDPELAEPTLDQEQAEPEPAPAGPVPAVEVAEDESPLIEGDPGLVSDELDDTLIQEIESRLSEELSREGDTRRYKGQKVELDKADLDLELDDTVEPEEAEEPPPAVPAPVPAPEPAPEAGSRWTRWPVLVAAGIVAAVLGGGLILTMRAPPKKVAPQGRTVWRGTISGSESLQLALEPFLVPIKGAPARRLKVILVIVLSDFRARDHFRRLSPSLIACRNAVYQILTHKTIEELTLNREQLQNQIRTRLNQIISSGKVTQVHFTQFLMT
jgi:flagellar basal body-associated protein FliL